MKLTDPNSKKEVPFHFKTCRRKDIQRYIKRQGRRDRERKMENEREGRTKVKRMQRLYRQREIKIEKET